MKKRCRSLPNIEKLARLHPGANDPYNPFCGVGALFNGDLQRLMRKATDRAKWEVLSPYDIRYLGNSEMSVVDQIVEKIFELADEPDSGVDVEADEAVSWGEGDSCIRLLSLRDLDVSLLQRIDEKDGIASTRTYLFDGSGIIRTIFTFVTIEELGSRDWVEEAITSDPTQEATSKEDEDDFFNTLLYPLRSNGLVE